MKNRFKTLMNHPREARSSSFSRLRNRFEENNNKIKLLGMMLFVAVVVFTYQSTFHFQLYFNDKRIGVIEKKIMAKKALAIIEEDVANIYGEDSHFQSKMTFKSIRVPKKQLLEQKQLTELIYDQVEIYRPGAVIIVDDKESVFVDSLEVAEKILEEIKKTSVSRIEAQRDHFDLVSVLFSQEVQVIEKDVLVDKTLSKEQALLLLRGNEEQTKRQEAFSVVSRANDRKIRTQEKFNIQINEASLTSIMVEKPYIDVLTVVKQSETVDIDYKVEKRTDSSMYKGESKVKEEGKKGKKEIVKEITYLNESIHEEKVISEKIIYNPTTKIEIIGTKARPSARKAAPTYNGDLGSSIVATARHYIGVPYVHGGASPSGFDCSGFTQYVYGQYGISIPRTTGGQAAVGGYVSRDQLKPGDLVIFSGHTGIYVGSNRFIHSPKPGKSVQITSLSNSYWRNAFISGRRVY